MKTIKRVVILSMALASAGVFAQSAPVSDLSSGSASGSSETLLRLLEQSQQRQLDIQRTLDSLAEDVNTLRGETEVHSHQLEQLEERQRELYQELEERFSRFSANQTQQSTLTPSIPVTTSPGSVATPPPSQTEVVYSGSISENEAYDRAMNLVLKERKYDQAVPEFRAFIKQFPDSAYAPNAHYWLGQLLFNKGSYPEARGQFEQVVNYYPDSNKRSDAILKLGSIALKNNDMAGAKVFFEKVIAEYPGSTSAKLATSRLDTLK